MEPGLIPGLGFLWSLVVPQLLPYPATATELSQAAGCSCMSWAGLWWSHVLLLFPSCVAQPALSPLQQGLCSCHCAHPQHSGQPCAPNHDRLDTKAFVRHQGLSVQVLRLSPGMVSSQANTLHHPTLPVGKGILGC